MNQSAKLTADKNELKLLYSIHFINIKKVERSDSLILVILGNLGHFRHSFISLYQSVIIRG